MLIDPQPLLPTRGYRVLCHDATLIDLEAEGMWAMGRLSRQVAGRPAAPPAALLLGIAGLVSGGSVSESLNH